MSVVSIALPIKLLVTSNTRNSVPGDAKNLHADHKIKVQNLVELSWLSRQADAKLLRCGGKSNARTLISLQKLTAAYLGRDLVKSPVRTGNWELMLDEEQLTCEFRVASFLSHFSHATDAANDAHCAVTLYHHLMALAKAEKQTLWPGLYTLNVNVDGEVVPGPSEADRSDEMDAFEVEADVSTPAVPPTAPGSAPAPPPHITSRARAPPSRTTAPKLPAPPRSTVSSATITTSRKRPATAAISSRTPEIIELSDSDSDVDELAKAMFTPSPIRSSKPRLTDMELRQLAEVMKDSAPFVSTLSTSDFTSTLETIRKSTRLSDVELRKLAEEFQGVNLNGDAMVGAEEQHLPARRRPPPSAGAVTQMSSSSFAAAPFSEGSHRVSRTMAYALGVRK
jgi:hypothetical protein